MSIGAHFLYALLWLSFGAVHSALAGPRMKQRLAPLLGRGYRLAYNLFALLTIGLVMYGGRYVIAYDVSAFDLTPLMLAVLRGLMGIGALIFLAALTQYDLGRFAGITQIVLPAKDDIEEPLHLGGFHRYVRHPLYSGAHLYFWGSIRNEFDLATAIWASLYFVIGSYFEEQKLVATYGDAYARYCKQVPSVIPWRGRAI